MFCNILHVWWSTQSQLATLPSSLIAFQCATLQPLSRFRLKDLSIDEMGLITYWISFAPVFSFMYCLVLALSPFYILIYMFLEMMHG